MYPVVKNIFRIKFPPYYKIYITRLKGVYCICNMMGLIIINIMIDDCVPAYITTHLKLNIMITHKEYNI